MSVPSIYLVFRSCRISPVFLLLYSTVILSNVLCVLVTWPTVLKCVDGDLKCITSHLLRTCLGLPFKQRCRKFCRICSVYLNGSYLEKYQSHLLQYFKGSSRPTFLTILAACSMDSRESPVHRYFWGLWESSLMYLIAHFNLSMVYWYYVVYVVFVGS